MLSIQQMLLGATPAPTTVALGGRRIAEWDALSYSGSGDWVDLTDSAIHFIDPSASYTSSPIPYFQVSNNNNLTASSSNSDVAGLTHFSVAVWLNLDQLPVAGGDKPIVSTSTWGLRLDNANLLNLVKWNVVDQNVTINTFPTGNWCHLVASIDATETRYYINGVKVGVFSSSATVNPSNGTLYVNAYANLFMKISKVQIYNYPLSDIAVVGLFNSECYQYSVTALPIPSTELDPAYTLAYLDPKNMMAASNLIDASGNGHNMVLDNSNGSISYNSRFLGVMQATGSGGITDGFKMSANWQNYGTMTVMVASRYISSTQSMRILAADNNWLLGHWWNQPNVCYLDDTTGWVSNSTPPLDTTWRIYTATINNNTNTHSFYSNGALVNTKVQGVGVSGPNNLQLFKCGQYPQEHSNGQAGVLIVWNYILSEAEIARAYEYFRCRYGI